MVYMLLEIVRFDKMERLMVIHASGKSQSAGLHFFTINKFHDAD